MATPGGWEQRRQKLTSLSADGLKDELLAAADVWLERRGAPLPVWLQSSVRLCRGPGGLERGEVVALLRRCWEKDHACEGATVCQLYWIKKALEIYDDTD